MSPNERLAHALKLLFGTGPAEPNSDQLAQIKLAIVAVRQKGKNPENEDWYAVVHQYCPTAGTHRYAGVDNSDLNTLLALALQSTSGQG